VAAGLNATQGRAYREKVVGFDIDILKDPYTKKVKENKKGTLFLDYEFGNQHPSIEGMELKPPWIDMPIWNKDKDEDKLVGWFGVDIVGGKKSQLKKNDIERLWQYSEEIRRALVEGPAESRVDPILREIVSIARFNLSGVNNVKEALSITIKAVNDCIPCHDIQIRLLEDNRLQLLKCLNSEFPQSQENIPEDDPDSFAAYVARGRHALYIGDYKQHEERIKKGSGLIPGRTPPAGLSLAVLPLIVEWEFLGTLRIEPKEQIDWEKSDLKYALFKLSSRAALLLRDIKTDRQVVEGNAAERELNQAFGAIHGIRGPSQAVRNYLQTIMSIHERGDLTVDKAVSLVSAAASSLSRIERLADRLMRLVGQRRKPLHDINIMEIIKSCITESEYLYPKMTFEFSVSNEAESIHVEPDEFRAVLDELITNSSRATNKEGLIKISAFSDQDTITITVQDNGPGIKADELEHIFDRWYSGFGGGTGLGLSFAKKVVEDLDGQVFAELSNPGLQIIIRIPKAAD